MEVSDLVTLTKLAKNYFLENTFYLSIIFAFLNLYKCALHAKPWCSITSGSGSIVSMLANVTHEISVTLPPHHSYSTIWIMIIIITLVRIRSLGYLTHSNSLKIFLWTLNVQYLSTIRLWHEDGGTQLPV